MKKTLLTIAMLAAANAAVAQTESPITLYGRVYVTAESVEASGAPAAVPRRTRASDQASNFGIRGSESLGGGVSAFFQLETQFKPDQNDTTFANRNSGVGLRTAAGTLLIGRWDTPFKIVNGDVDPYDDLTIGGFGTALQGSGIANVNTQFDRRDQNVVQYWSPKWGGFELRLSYSANEARTASVNPRSEGASVVWRGGPVYVGYAYHELRDMAFGVYTNGAAVPPSIYEVGSVNVSKQTASALFGTVDAGPLRFGVDYQEFRRSGPAMPALVTAATVVGFEKQKAFLANVVWTIGNHQLIYQYTKAKDGGQQNFDARTTPRAPECSAHAPGYRYNFSRRTFFLLQYVKVTNNETGTCNFGFNTLAIVPGQDPDGWSLGLRHAF
jgi:predicted porin